MDVAQTLRRSRQVIAVLADARLRAALIAGTGGLDRPAPRFDWIGPDGTIDVALLRGTIEGLEALRSDQAVLRFDPVRELPADEERRRRLSIEIVELALARLGAPGALSEERLNAALAMLVRDVATVRRDAVDAAVLTRTADGRTYRPASAAPPTGATRR